MMLRGLDRAARVLVCAASLSAAAAGCAKNDRAAAAGPATSPAVQQPAAPEMVTRVYDVRGLLIDMPDFEDVPDFNLKRASAPPPASQPATRPTSVRRSREEAIEDLEKLIRESVEPASWTQGAMIRELSGQFIITNTPTAHAKIADLLEDLRQTRARQVSVEARFLTFGPAAIEQMDQELRKTLWPPTDKANGAIPAAPTYLTDSQVNQLLRVSQADPASTVTQPPRVTLFNGQRAYVLAATQRSYVADYSKIAEDGKEPRFEPVIEVVDAGVKFDVRAIVSADRKFVTLTLHPQLCKLVDMKELPWPDRPAGSDLKVEVPVLNVTEVRSTVSVPDGSTLLLAGLQDVQVSPASPATNPATQPAQASRMLLLVKPTVITGAGETEQRQFLLLKTRVE